MTTETTHARAGDTSAVWDREAALEALGGSEDLLREMAELLREEAPPLLEAIAQGLARSDAKAVFESAHRLKGAVSVFRAPPVVEAVFEIERLGRDGRLAAVPAALERARARVASLIEAVG